MQICQRHGDMMRAAVEARGMTALVASNGRAAMDNLVDELRQGSTTDNFDPLMAMNWNISTNLMEKLGPSALYLLASGPEDVIDIDRLTDPALKEKYRGKTWPRCPICYANIAHEFSCADKGCRLARVDGWDVCIDMSADTIKAEFDRMMKAGGRCP